VTSLRGQVVADREVQVDVADVAAEASIATWSALASIR